MELNLVIIANIINGIGVLSLLASHTFISLSSPKKGFILSFLGGTCVSYGSYLLESYPIVILNILWMLISVYGFYNQDKKDKNETNYKCKTLFYVLTLTTSALLCYFFLVDSNIHLLAYYTTFIYVSVYFLFAAGWVSKESYLFWCLTGFFLVLPHLFDKMQYAIFLNEGYGAIVSVLGLLKSYKNKKMHKKEATEPS